MAGRQLSFAIDGRIRDNVEQAIDILRMFEPKEGYYLAFSGGKDSQCVYHLAQLAGVKFDAHYSVTSVDPPELVRFIKTQYPDVSIDIPHDADGKPVKGIKRHPNIGDNVIIYSGATILGGDTNIGEGSIIGSNVWLMESVEPNSTVYNSTPSPKIK